MRYRTEQLENVSCGEIASSIAGRIMGCRAVNTSFDSGRLSGLAWKSINGFAVTPPITAPLIAVWPVSHDGYGDEWWVFDGEIPEDFRVHSFCNFAGARIADYKDLDWEEGCPLDTYLERFQPVIVFGNNEWGYIITRTDWSSGGNSAALCASP